MVFSKKNIPNEFYVYLYLRDDGTPYYVGKGKGKRAWNRSARAVKPPVNENKIQVVQHQLTEQQAFDLEIELVSKYGRLDEGTGILRNGTDGGEGTSGHKKPEGWGESHGELIKQMIADGRIKTIGELVRGKKQSAEHVEKRIKAHIGSKRPKETGDKIRKKAIGRVQSQEIIDKRILYVTCEYCGKEVDKGNYTRWHGDKCKHNHRR